MAALPPEFSLYTDFNFVFGVNRDPGRSSMCHRPCRQQERLFVTANFLSAQTLGQIAQMRAQFAELLSEIGFVQNGIRAKVRAGVGWLLLGLIFHRIY